MAIKFSKKNVSGRVSVSAATLQMGQIPNPHQDYIVGEILCHVKSSNFWTLPRRRKLLLLQTRQSLQLDLPEDTTAPKAANKLLIR